MKHITHISIILLGLLCAGCEISVVYPTKCINGLLYLRSGDSFYKEKDIKCIPANDIR